MIKLGPHIEYDKPIAYCLKCRGFLEVRYETEIEHWIQICVNCGWDRVISQKGIDKVVRNCKDRGNRRFAVSNNRKKGDRS